MFGRSNQWFKHIGVRLTSSYRTSWFFLVLKKGSPAKGEDQASLSEDAAGKTTNPRHIFIYIQYRKIIV